MSIDAIVQAVLLNKNGSGELRLVARKPRSAPAGQTVLLFDASPPNVSSLEGCEIWGGANGVMLGNTEIAERQGYTKIRFIVEDLSLALQSYMGL